MSQSWNSSHKDDIDNSSLSDLEDTPHMIQRFSGWFCSDLVVFISIYYVDYFDWLKGQHCVSV